MKDSDIILSGHGSGGRLSNELISEIVLPLFNNDIISKLDDGAVFEVNGVRLAFSTDTYTVDPIFFPGGDIGDLAINGTVNDISMCGAEPIYLSMGLVIEEGFEILRLKKILKSMSIAAKKAGIQIVTGDTKVVPRGAADKIFINTSGIGIIPKGINVSSVNAQVRDSVILSGTLGDHGVTILTKREGFDFETSLKSDTAPLNRMVKTILSVCRETHVFRDPTRGGLGTSLNEIAKQSKVEIEIYEEKIPVKKEVSGICRSLGLDPLYMANEGKLIAFVPNQYAQSVLSAIKKDEYGVDAAIIGEVIQDGSGKVFMKTEIGGTRIVDMLTGEYLPRIC